MKHEEFLKQVKERDAAFKVYGTDDCSRCDRDSYFIAAANPQAIIELLDRLERYEKALRDVGTYHSHDSLIQSVFETAREALEGGK